MVALRFDELPDFARMPPDEPEPHDRDRHEPEPHEPEAAPRRAVPDPLDRIWRHPSELNPAEMPAAAPSSPRSSRTGPSSSRRARPRRWLVPVGAALAGAGGTIALLVAFGAVTLDRSVDPAAADAARVPAPKAVATRLAPSIVAVSVRDAGGLRRGSGVCIRHEGEILTSARLVAGADRIDVLTVDGMRAQATVVGIDPTTDLALLRIDEQVVAVEIARTRAGVGDPVYAVGADGSGHATPWVSRGIVASTDGLVALADGPAMAGLIQTDAIVDAAGAGGALVDDDGNVIGVLFAPIANRPGAMALPIDLATEVADRLRSLGHADHGWLGVRGVDTPEGPWVVAVTDRGPAARSGLAVGDVVRSIDGRVVSTMAEVTAVVRRNWPGEQIEIEVVRGRRSLRIRVRVAPTPTPDPATGDGEPVVSVIASGGRGIASG